MGPTTITGVRTIGIKVRDQDAATEFYVAALGFEKRLDAPMSQTTRWIEVAPPGATTSIALNLNDRDQGVPTDTGVRFIVPDADAEHAALLYPD